MELYKIALTNTNESSSSVIEKIKGEEIAVLTEAPNVPPPITRNYATKVIVQASQIRLALHC